MKKFNTKSKLKLSVLLMTSSLIVLQPLLANNTGKEDPAKKDKRKSEKSSNKQNSLNNESVKIYPDILKRDMHVVVKNNSPVLDFFVFDIQGTLISNYKMQSKDHIKLTNLKKGIYIYRVFNGDAETATGQFEIR